MMSSSNRFPSLLFLLLIFALSMPYHFDNSGEFDEIIVSDAVCTPYGCCDRLSNCSDIALNKQCKQYEYDCQLSCGTCNAIKRGSFVYRHMLHAKESGMITEYEPSQINCSYYGLIGYSWNNFESSDISDIITPNNVDYLPGHCMFGMYFDFNVPKNCGQLDYWNNYFNGKLTFLHVVYRMNINTSCDTTHEFFKSVEIFMGQECILNVNDLSGSNRTIFDFFPSLKFVGLEFPERLTGALICGNTIEEARLSRDQKESVNRIDQGRLLGRGKLLGNGKSGGTPDYQSTNKSSDTNNFF